MKVPRPGLFEFVHHILHALPFIDILRGGMHIIEYMLFVVKFRTEHVLSDILQRDISLEMVLRIDDRENISGRNRYCLYERSKGCVYGDRSEGGLHQIGHLQERKDSLVAVVRDQFAGIGDSLCVDLIFLHLNKKHK